MSTWRWPLALVFAAGLHVLLFAALPEPHEPPGAESEGEGGLLIALAPAGGTPGDTGEPVAEAEPEPATEPAVEPEPVREPEPLAEPEPEPVVEREAVPSADVDRAEPEVEDTLEVAPEPIELPEETAADAGTGADAGTREGGDRGEADGATTAGGGDPGAVADYHTRLQAHLARFKRYPRQAQRRREEGVVILAFIAHADGAVSEVEIMEGSGSRLLDEAALDMVERARPLPEFTDDMGARQLRIQVPVSFNLR